jgi:hypothetical protein
MKKNRIAQMIAAAALLLGGTIVGCAAMSDADETAQEGQGDVRTEETASTHHCDEARVRSCSTECVRHCHQGPHYRECSTRCESNCRSNICR